ncbi:CCHC-type zinc finger protein [Frankliniella fusca]|uniref:CCHC-type zinc finger protein n=1 Tax=Frankliniella fusca TaxID=407009 RepID=A0AAE1H376_9NEOP|nr:CCHC-type zinc finger protein [Frankliniella fusca]
MSDNLKRPGPVNLKAGNIQKSSETFKQKFGFYLIAIGKTKAAPEVKFALLMGEAGDEALEVYNSFKDKLITKKLNDQNVEVIDVDNSTNYDHVLEQFDQYAAERKCVTGCRELFNARNQKSNELFSNWLPDLRNLIKDCEYGPIVDSMLKDRIIWGIHDKKLRDSIRAKSNQSLTEIIEVCKAVEATSKYPRYDNGEGHADVNAIQQVAKKFKKNYKGKDGGSIHTTKNNHHWRKNTNKSYQKGNDKKLSKFTYHCRKCDKTHEAGNCPAWGTTCSKCKGRNHFQVVCKSKKGYNNQSKPQKNVDSLTQVTNALSDILLNQGWTSETNQVSVHMLTVVHKNNKKIILSGESSQPRNEYTEVLKLQNEHYVKFKLDSGSEVNSLPLEVFNLINRNYPVYKTNILLKAYGKVLSSPEGKVRLMVEAPHGDKLMCTFVISSIEPKPLLGKEACEKLNLVVRVVHPIKNVQTMECLSIKLPESQDQFVQKFEKLFTGMGEFHHKVRIVVDPTLQPTMCPARRYHFSIIQRLKPQLDDLEKTGIIARITKEIPKFVSNMVIREKSNGDLRICLDPEQLNKAIVRQRLKKMRIKLLRFQPEVQYLPGKHMHIAGLLSRNCLDDPVQDDPEMVEVVHEVTKYIPLSHNLRLALIRETENDADSRGIVAERRSRSGRPLKKSAKISDSAFQY